MSSRKPSTVLCAPSPSMKFSKAFTGALTAVLTGLSEFENPDSPVKTAVKAPVKAFENFIEGLGAHNTVLGFLLLIVGLALILLALAYISRNMKLVVAGRIERSMNAVLAKGRGVTAIGIGLIMTVAVQSSSITTSVLVPMIAAGVLTLTNPYPITLGSNVGTTVTALLA